MSIFRRMSTIFKSKANKALDKAEDPRETLDYSYQKQLEMLQKVRRGVADVATSRKRVELQASTSCSRSRPSSRSGPRHSRMGREDLAREALTRRSGMERQVGDLQAQHARCRVKRRS